MLFRSFPYTGSAIITGSLFVTGSTQITGSLTINNALSTAIQTTLTAGSNPIYSLATASYDGAWFEYITRSGSNARAGQIMAIWSGSQVNFTETTTNDFGSTSGVDLGVFIVGGNMALTGSVSAGTWTFKTIIRSI
mgnify:FL=1